MLDAPWSLRLRAIANLWPAPACASGWSRAFWPGALGGRAVAPLDLQVGHVLELTTIREAVAYGWVADVDALRFVLVAAPDANNAVATASRALAVWQAAELAQVENNWRQRLMRSQQ